MAKDKKHILKLSEKQLDTIVDNIDFHYSLMHDTLQHSISMSNQNKILSFVTGGLVVVIGVLISFILFIK